MCLLELNREIKLLQYSYFIESQEISSKTTAG